MPAGALGGSVIWYSLWAFVHIGKVAPREKLPLPTLPLGSNCVGLTTVIVKVPLAARLPPTPVMVTCSPVVRPWTEPVVMRIGVELLALVIVPEATSSVTEIGTTGLPLGSRMPTVPPWTAVVMVVVPAGVEVAVSGKTSWPASLYRKVTRN